MASTYTTNIGIEKPATGEQSGTWGDTTNTNFDIIDQAIGGVQAVTLSTAGSSGSPNTLDITDGAVSNGRNKYISFVDGGDLGGTAFVQLTPNDAEKVVYVRNSLSGSRSILIFQGTYDASRDLEIPNGRDVLIKFNGGGSTATVTFLQSHEYYVGNTQLVGAVDVTGDLDVDNININGNTISSTDTNGNITLTPNGTGEVNLLDNDKLTFGAGSDLEISHNGTENVIDSNAGTLVLRSAGAGTIEMRDQGSQVLAQFNDNSDVKLYHNNNPKLATTNTGVDVTGNAKFTGTGRIIKFDKNGSGEDNAIYYDNSTANNNLFIGRDSSNIAFRTGGSERVRINSSGNIGIGTSAPSTFLDIEGANARLDINETSTGSPQIQFQVNGTEKATISAGSGGTLQLSADADQRFKVGGTSLPLSMPW